MPRRFIGGRWVEIPSFELGPESSPEAADPERLAELVEQFPELEGRIHSQADLDQAIQEIQEMGGGDAA